MNNKPQSENIYASAVAIEKKGILLVGHSGSGKSDLALRLIMNKKAALVADDRVEISLQNGDLYANAPEKLFGLLEVRGIGIVNFSAEKNIPIALAVKLKNSWQEIERMPEKQYLEISGKKIPLMEIYPFEASAVDKIVIKLKAVLDKTEKNSKMG